MNQRTIIIIAVLAVAVAALWWWNKRKKAQAAAIETPLIPITPTVSVPATSQTTIPTVPLNEAGNAVYPSGTNANIRQDASTASKVIGNVAGGKQIGQTTGVTKKQTDGVWLQVRTATGASGWVRSDVVRVVRSSTNALKAIAGRTSI